MDTEGSGGWSRPTTALVGAFAGGAIGFLIGISVIDWMDRAPLDLTLEMLIAMCIAGGWGWVIGAALGWSIGWARPAPSHVGRTLFFMSVLAAWFVWFGLSSIHCARSGSFGPMIDDIRPNDPLRDRLATSVAVDTALAVTTLVVLAGYTIVRGDRRRVSKRRSSDHAENS